MPELMADMILLSDFSPGRLSSHLQTHFLRFSYPSTEARFLQSEIQGNLLTRFLMNSCTKKNANRLMQSVDIFVHYLCYQIQSFIDSTVRSTPILKRKAFEVKNNKNVVFTWLMSFKSFQKIG